MGERPINALTDPHPWKGAAQGKLSEASHSIQSRGWWFNLELLTLEPNIVDSYIYLPGDALDVRTQSSMYVARNGRVFNLDGGTYEFTDSVDIELVREIPFEDLPGPAQSYVEAAAVLNFQKDYDGDTAKTRELKEKYSDARVAFNKAATIASRTNMITNNFRLMQLKGYTSRIRAWRRS